VQQSLSVTQRCLEDPLSTASLAGCDGSSDSKNQVGQRLVFANDWLPRPDVNEPIVMERDDASFVCATFGTTDLPGC
jgi:hypothetical protein